jgi:2,5-furandicarboxylate decarboxylase 1
MADQSIRRHLAALDAAGDLVRFTREVDPDENLSALSWKTFARLGRSCLFESVAGHPGWRVASQIVADRRKWGTALGVAEGEVVETLGRRIARPIAPVDIDASEAPVKEVVAIGRDVDLRRIPAMWTSERDPGRYIASGMCLIKDPETGIRNMSVHRAQIIAEDRTGYLICPRQALKIYQMYEALGRPMEAAMVVGGHPLIMFAAGYVAPYGQDELHIAGGLLEEPVRLARCETIDMEVPADAELVLEGELHPGERTPEGPFGEVTGTYAQEGSTPLFRVKAVTHRRDPIFYAMQCGLPPSDTHSIICSTIEMRLWKHLTDVVGGLDLLDVRCLGGVSPMIVAIRLRPRLAGQGMSALLAALSSPYLHPKIAVAVDADIDIADPAEVLWAMANRVDAAVDVRKIDGVRVFALDNASPIEEGRSAMYRVGTKVLIDATLAPGSEGPAFPYGAPPKVDLGAWL